MATHPADAKHGPPSADEIENGGRMPQAPVPVAPLPDKRRQRCSPCIAFAMMVSVAIGLMVTDLNGLSLASPANVTLVVSPPDAHAPEGAALTMHLHGILNHRSIAHTAELDGITCRATLAGAGVGDEAAHVGTASLDMPVALAASGSRTSGSATLYAWHPSTLLALPRPAVPVFCALT